MDQDIRVKAVEALAGLREHPAVSPEILGDSICDGLWFHMAKCCKRGTSESNIQEVTVYRGEEGWEKWKDLFEEEYKNEELEEQFQSVEIPYETFHGEPWAFDHVEYWYEITFFVFDGDPYSERDYMDYKKWARYGGPEGGANSFDEMLIDAWEKVKKAFGDYERYECFDSTEEKANHEDHNMFLSTERGDGEVLSFPLVRDEEYMNVDNGLINLRWLEWFMTTDYFKENWGEDGGPEFQAAVDKIKSCEPEKRKSILAKYKKEVDK